MNIDQLPANVIAYFNELAADIAAHGGLKEGQSMEDAVKEAHARRQAFAMEMAEGRTDRAQKVRRVLGAQVYGAILVNNTIEQIEREGDEANRTAFLQDYRNRHGLN